MYLQLPADVTKIIENNKASSRNLSPRIVPTVTRRVDTHLL